MQMGKLIHCNNETKKRVNFTTFIMSPYAIHSIITTLEPIDTYISHIHIDFICYCLT